MSVFTFDPDPPRVSSPWLPSEGPTKSHSEKQGDKQGDKQSSTPDSPVHSLLSEYGVSKLPPEPQEGPTEYKLHLLLRLRRAYKYISTAQGIAGSQHVKYVEIKGFKPRSVAVSTSGQSRIDRCQQLTTQLLWRLRQSSPYHASASYMDFTVPPLPDDATLINLEPKIGKLAPGLEESRGALYEIGVSDDGVLVGITKDEMDQSIATLRWMAASLGCAVEILRMVLVGDCEWIDDNDVNLIQKEGLFVAEVLVKPHLTTKKVEDSVSPSKALGEGNQSGHSAQVSQSGANQLRVTLTGATTSGKSTLLGTLSTGTLDDGHGKSRLNSLKHRHELASGMTSTVTQELIGYRDNSIINYANPNIESWIGIHDFTERGRLVLMSDSAGHPRYRRTTMRGIVGWAPHWTILCMAADHNASPTSGGTSLFTGIEVAAEDLAKAHLDLCLKLELPLVIIITKSDLLDKVLLRRLLTPIWTAVKSVGRTPQLLQSKDKSPENLREVSKADNDAIRRLLVDMGADTSFQRIVPVVLTSSVSGDGIGLVHSLLQSLPLPSAPTAHDFVGMALNPEQPTSLFHVEDKFSLPASYASVSTENQSDLGTVVSGYLRFGTLSVGNKLVVGPFPSEEDDQRGLTPDDRPSPGNYSLSISHPSSSELNRIALRNAVSASAIKGEWHSATVVSIRNLRLPVQTLQGGQAGTIGLVFNLPKDKTSDGALERPPSSLPKLRKGMVLAIPSKHMLNEGLQLQAASGLTAFFDDPNITSLAVGTGVTFYVASVRAQARILRVSSGKTYHGNETVVAEEEDVFAFNEQLEGDALSPQTSQKTGFEVRFELLYSREWIELGSRLVILEGASKDGSVLDGFIGRVVEIVD